jgi:mono/diheme cytochrome c family protein
MQHNARDPLRDHVHGRVYRVTYPSRPLVTPAKVAGATIPELLDNLKLPEFRTRYRTRRELRGRDPEDVLKAVHNWVANLNIEDENYDHHVLEALWVTWGLNRVDEQILHQVLQSQDFRARAAAVRVLRYSGHQIENQVELLRKAAADEHGRVRLEAIVAASWLDREAGLSILKEAGNHPLDDWMIHAYETAAAHLEGKSVKEKKEEEIKTDLKGAERELFVKGKEIYAREGFCITCHQPDGAGLTASGFPPLANTPWVEGNQDRLIKLVLKGLQGPIEVKNVEYAGHVPMTPFEGMLNDEEVAAVLTYVRNAFGNDAPAVTPEKVKQIRASISEKKGFFTPSELLRQHPMEK